VEPPALPLRPADEARVEVLLPASLANILVTGVLSLAADKLGPSGGRARTPVAADVTQAIVAVAILYFVVAPSRGCFTPRKTAVRPRRIVGAQSPRAGGTKAAPMQA
jgi:hypothetical protein